MKRTKLFGLLMAMIMGVAFTACEEDEDTDSILITIDSTTPVPTEAVPVGTVLKFDYVVVSDNNIEEIIIREGSTVLESIPNDDKELTAKKSHKGSFSFVTTDIETLKFAIEVEDSKGTNALKAFEVEVVAAPGEISTFKAVLLGNQGTTAAGSFYSTSTNQVFLLAQSATNAAKIDIVYLLDGTKHVIAAPSDAFVASKFADVKDWSVKNATKLVITTMTSNDFAAIINDAKITEQTKVELSKVDGLMVGDVVAFTTAQDKKGLFKIESIADNTMTIEVKVQK